MRRLYLLFAVLGLVALIAIQPALLSTAQSAEPTPPLQIGPSPTPSPTPTPPPVTPTPALIQTIGETNKAGVFTDPKFGWVVSWLSALWDTSEYAQRTYDTYHMFELFGKTAYWYISFQDVDGTAQYDGDVVTNSGHQGIRGSFRLDTEFNPNDLAACVSEVASAIDGKGNPLQQQVGPNGQPLQGTTKDRVWAVYSGNDAYSTVVYAQYIECRVLVPGKQVLFIWGTIPLNEFNSSAAALQDLLSTVHIPAPHPGT